VGVVVELQPARRARAGTPSCALAGRLRRVAETLDRNQDALRRCAETLTAALGGLDRLNDELAAERAHARQISVFAERTATAIAAGDVGAMTALQGELTQLVRTQAADRVTAARACPSP